MSIYVGGEKAKLYRGDYGPAQLYKGDVEIAGYTDHEKVGTQISGVDTYNDALNLTIEGKSEQTVTANSPSPDYPSPIRSSENFDVVSCGKNLAPHSDFSKNHDGWVKNQAAEITQGVDYVQCIMKQTFSTPGLIRSEVITNLVKGKTYTMTVCAKAVGLDKAFLKSIGSNIPPWDGLIFQDKFTTITRTFVASNIGDYDILFYFANPQLDTGFQIKWFQIEEGAPATPYEPYHATTAHITDPLRSVGNVSDSIEVSNGKVEVIRRIAVVKLTGDALTERWEQYPASVGKRYICMFGNFLLKKLVGDIFCTHAKQTLISTIAGTELEIWTHNLPSFASYMYWGIEYSLIGTNQTSTAEENKASFRAWLSAQATAENPVTVQYQIETPTRTDITTTPLGQALLAMRTYPHYTQVYTNATLPPTLRARIKEMVL